jgi:hypothetical protein
MIKRIVQPVVRKSNTLADTLMLLHFYQQQHAHNEAFATGKMSYLCMLFHIFEDIASTLPGSISKG